MKLRILPILIAPVLALGLTRSQGDAIESPVAVVATVRYLAHNLPEIEEVEESEDIGDRVKRLLETRECRGCNLAGVDLRGVDLSGVDLHEVNLENADLREVNLTNALIRKTNVKNARLDCAKLDFSFIDESDFSGANLKYASLHGARMFKTEFIKADLRHANLSHASGWVNFNDGRLDFATMDFVNFYHQDSENSKFTHVSLYGAKLSGEFQKSDFSYANLAYTNLEYNRFQEANLSNSNLTGANLNSTKLNNANLDNIQVEYASLLDAEGIEEPLIKNLYKKRSTISLIRNSIFEILSERGLLKAKIYYDLNNEYTVNTYRGILQISWNEEIVFEEEISFYSYDVSPRHGNLRILNLDRDSDLEIIVNHDHVGGVRCCHFHRVYDRDPRTGNYTLYQPNIWSEWSYHISDLDRDGRIEFEGVDTEWAYNIKDQGLQVFAPIQILHYQDGETIDVTRNYPEHIIPQVHYYWNKLRLEEEGKRITGIIKLYMAVQYLLGNEQEGWKKVEQYLLSNEQEKWKQIEQLYKKSRTEIDFLRFKNNTHDSLYKQGYATSPTLVE